jgi:crossover junction endodeoxyribonuclease RuvC
MRILGIDPGMQRLGIGAVKIQGNDTSLLTYGMISHPRDSTVTFNEHLNAGIKQITVDFPKLIDMIGPDVIYSEIVPVGRLGSNSELVVAAATACKVIAFQFGIAWQDIGANTIKKELTGDGKATKAQVKRAVFALYPKVEEQHKRIKQQEKSAGEKQQGLPQDVMDAVGIAHVGALLNGINLSGQTSDNKGSV